MKAFRTLLCLTLTLAIAGGVMADDKKPAKKGEGKKPAAAGDAAKKRAEGRKAPAISQLMLRGIELTEEQKKAVAPIDKEFGAKFAELQKAQRDILTEEQRQSQATAIATIRESGKRPTPEQRKQLANIVKLSDEQKKKQSEVRKAQGELRTAYLAKVDSILTADQKAKLKSRGGKRPAKGDAAGKKPGTKKPGTRKPGDKKPAAKKDGAAKKPAKKDAA